MATVTRASSVAFTLPPSTQPSEIDNQCLSRTTKIALAIFASLAGFVFIPFGMAIALSVVVALGAIVCCPEDAIPERPASNVNSLVAVAPPSLSPERILPCPALHPTEIIIPDVNSTGSDNVIISFQTPEARRQFDWTYKANFENDAGFYPVVHNPFRINIRLHEKAMSEGKSVQCILDKLENIFGRLRYNK
jgi:hypothetical protein